MPPDRIRPRRTRSRRPGRVEILHPVGSPFGHTNGAQNPSTDVRTDTTRIRAGDIFLGVVPSRHGAGNAHFRILELRRGLARIRIKSHASSRPLEVWVDENDICISIVMRLVHHVSEAPFEI